MQITNKTIEKAKKFLKDEQENMDFWQGWLRTADSKFRGRQLETEENRAMEAVEESEIKVEALKMLIEDYESKEQMGKDHDEGKI